MLLAVQSSTNVCVCSLLWMCRSACSISSTNNVDALFQIETKVDANDDVATLLRTTKRFIGSSKALPSERIDIQKISEFSLREDNGEAASKKVGFFSHFHSRIKSVSSSSTVQSLNSSHLTIRITSTFIASRRASPSVWKCCTSRISLFTRLVGPANIRILSLLLSCRLLLTSKNREFVLYYDFERDVSSRIYNIPGLLYKLFWRVGYQEMKKGVLCISPDGLTALLISSRGCILTVDLKTRHVTHMKQLASSVCDACFYDNSTCYLLTSRISFPR